MLVENCRRQIQIDAAFVQGMPKHSFAPIRGKVERFSFDSSLLDNQLGDPTEREIVVHWSLEGQHILDDGGSLPVIVYLAPFTSSAPARAGWKAFSESILQRHERLVRDGEMKPVFLVLPDTFTSLGGNQFIDSPILGKWSSWLSKELQQQINQRYSTNGCFSLVGKSSGGYGALVNSMLFPDHWVGAASHSGDVGFNFMFKHDFFHTLRRLERFNSIYEFIEYTQSSSSISYESMHDLMMVALAASYDPPQSHLIKDIAFPLHGIFHEFDEEKWENWLRWDPLNMTLAYSESLKKMKLVFIDCGNQDQYNIHFGTRLLHQLFDSLDIEHVYEEFEGTHSGIDYRLDTSMALLSQFELTYD